MVTLEKILKLDAMVQDAVDLIDLLREENDSLRKKHEDHQKRIKKLEACISDFKRDQTEIERGILNALSRLEEIDSEDTTRPKKSKKPGKKVKKNTDDGISKTLLTEVKPESIQTRKDRINKSQEAETSIKEKEDEELLADDNSSGEKEVELDIF